VPEEIPFSADTSPPFPRFFLNPSGSVIDLSSSALVGLPDPLFLPRCPCPRKNLMVRSRRPFMLTFFSSAIVLFSSPFLSFLAQRPPRPIHANPFERSFTNRDTLQIGLSPPLNPRWLMRSDVRLFFSFHPPSRQVSWESVVGPPFYHYPAVFPFFVSLDSVLITRLHSFFYFFSLSYDGTGKIDCFHLLPVSRRLLYSS